MPAISPTIVIPVIPLYASNLERSFDIYQHTFGCRVNKRDGNNQPVFGQNFLVLRIGSPAGKVDHFAIGVDNFNNGMRSDEARTLRWSQVTLKQPRP